MQTLGIRGIAPVPLPELPGHRRRLLKPTRTSAGCATTEPAILPRPTRAPLLGLAAAATGPDDRLARCSGGPSCSPACSPSMSPSGASAAGGCASSRSSKLPTTSPASSTGPARHPGPILPHRSCCSPADRALRRRAHPGMSLARPRRPRSSLPGTPIVQHVPGN